MKSYAHISTHTGAHTCVYLYVVLVINILALKKITIFFFIFCYFTYLQPLFMKWCHILLLYILKLFFDRILVLLMWPLYLHNKVPDILYKSIHTATVAWTHNMTFFDLSAVVQPSYVGKDQLKSNCILHNIAMKVSYS